MIEVPPKPNTAKEIKAALDKMGVKYKKYMINVYEQSLKKYILKTSYGVRICNKMSVVSFENFELDVTVPFFIDEDKIWFKAKHVARAMGYERPRDAIDRHVWDEFKAKFKELHKRCETRPLHPHTVFILEPGVYQLVFQSKLSGARQFQQWVFKEVLPSIRRTGMYTIPNALKQT